MVKVEVLTTAEAQARYDALVAEIGDVEKLKARGDAFELDADERVIYNELLNLEFLLGW